MVGHDVDPTGHRDAEMGGIEVREPELADESLFLQVLKPKEAIEPRRVSVAPSIELKEVDPFSSYPTQRPLDGPSGHPRS